jgi:hypothetical protein
MNEDDMCPNCITPWKCNGPHEFRGPHAEVFKDLTGRWWAQLGYRGYREDYPEDAVFETWAKAMAHAEWLVYWKRECQDTPEALRKRRVAGELGI